MNMMTTLPTISVSDIEGEPRVLDTDLGKALGMAKPTDIRRTILIHRAALEMLGPLRAERAKVEIGSGAQRAVTAYYLSEEQATYVTMHCKTERAQAVKVQLVKVFTAWRHGKLVPVVPAPIAIPQTLSEALRLAADEHDRANREEGLKLIAQAKVVELEPLAAVGELVCNHSQTLNRVVRSLLPKVNSMAVKGDLKRLKFLYERGGVYFVYNEHQDKFSERQIAEFGRVDIIVLPKGKQLLAQLDKAGKLTRKVAFRSK